MTTTLKNMKAKIIAHLKKKNDFFFISKFSSIRIAFLGMYLALLLALKYMLGFVLGIELVTFMFVIAGLFLPVKDGLILVLAFNLGVMAMYGFGTWEIMYFVIWPIDFLGTKLLSRISRNKYVIGIWGFLCGFSLLWWYFLSDLFFFGASFAIANTISALPVNLIEGFVTTFMIFLVGSPISKLFSAYSLQFWNVEKPFEFRKFKHEKMHLIITIVFLLALVGGVATLFVFNDWFLELKQKLFPIGAATYI